MVVGGMAQYSGPQPASRGLSPRVWSYMPLSPRSTFSGDSGSTFSPRSIASPLQGASRGASIQGEAAAQMPFLFTSAGNDWHRTGSLPVQQQAQHRKAECPVISPRRPGSPRQPTFLSEVQHAPMRGGCLHPMKPLPTSFPRPGVATLEVFDRDIRFPRGDVGAQQFGRPASARLSGNVWVGSPRAGIAGELGTSRPGTPRQDGVRAWLKPGSSHIIYREPIAKQPARSCCLPRHRRRPLDLYHHRTRA